MRVVFLIKSQSPYSCLRSLESVYWNFYASALLPVARELYSSITSGTVLTILSANSSSLTLAHCQLRLDVNTMDQNRFRHGCRKSIRFYEFRSHKSGAGVLDPLTLSPSCEKIIEQTLWTLNNRNKIHRRTRENARVLRHEGSLEDNPNQKYADKRARLGKE